MDPLWGVNMGSSLSGAGDALPSSGAECQLERQPRSWRMLQGDPHILKSLVGKDMASSRPWVQFSASGYRVVPASKHLSRPENVPQEKPCPQSSLSCLLRLSHLSSLSPPRAAKSPQWEELVSSDNPGLSCSSVVNHLPSTRLDLIACTLVWLNE